jgi:hypothetical protein
MTKSSPYSGHAAEHLVCADIIKQGYIAFLTAAGMPYDVLAEINGKLVRVQVKSTSSTRMEPGYNNACYRFKMNDAKSASFDILALVCPDDNVIAYAASHEWGDCAAIKLMPQGTEFDRRKKLPNIDHFTLHRALELL